MPAALSVIAVRDGNNALVSGGGLQALDISGTSAGPWVWNQVIVDGVAGVNRMGVDASGRVTTLAVQSGAWAVTISSGSLAATQSGAWVTSLTPAAALLTSAAINFSASGDNTIVAAVGGQTTKVYRLFFVVAAATTVKFKDGAGTDLTPFITLNAGGSIVLDYDSEPWFTTSVNTAFIINSSVAVQISGRAYYKTS